MAQRSFFSPDEFALILRDAQEAYDEMPEIEQRAWDMLLENLKHKLVSMGARSTQKGS